MNEQILRAAEGLRMLGVQKGDTVALVLPNCPQHIVAFYAALRLGAIVVEHNPLYTPRELRHQFEDHGAKVGLRLEQRRRRRSRTSRTTCRSRRIISIDVTARDALRHAAPAASCRSHAARESRAA